MRVEAYRAELEGEWDAFCGRSVNGSFLHSRRFLGYHADRFRDASALVLDDGDKLVAVLPAAADPADPGRVCSHPGATYGGLVHDGWLGGERAIAAIEALRAHYAAAGFKALRYKAMPSIHAAQPAQDDLYALWRAGAVLSRCDLSCAIDLERRRQPSERRRRGLKKAAQAVQVSGDPGLLPELWRLVSANLAREHGAKPVHSLEELLDLRARFPEKVLCRAALMNGRVTAGTILFNPGPSWHAQYIAADEDGYKVSALDAVFEAAITDARSAGARWFDFGTSNESEGRALNEGLYRFKSEFGGGGIAHLCLDLALG